MEAQKLTEHALPYAANDTCDGISTMCTAPFDYQSHLPPETRTYFIFLAGGVKRSWKGESLGRYDARPAMMPGGKKAKKYFGEASLPCACFEGGAREWGASTLQ